MLKKITILLYQRNNVRYYNNNSEEQILFANIKEYLQVCKLPFNNQFYPSFFHYMS